ncbi:hypothetical protein [Nostoc sp.]|uniref:hypothetical protein n=1 Tax=Nostoc sp. TaxID=1180 RepID=UPI003FA57F79
MLNILFFITIFAFDRQAILVVVVSWAMLSALARYLATSRNSTRRYANTSTPLTCSDVGVEKMQIKTTNSRGSNFKNAITRVNNFWVGNCFYLHIVCFMPANFS